MTVQVPVDRVVLSNMPVETEVVIGSNKRVSFQESPKMSTYLVAVVVGELEYLEGETPSGKLIVHKLYIFSLRTLSMTDVCKIQGTKFECIVRLVGLNKENLRWMWLQKHYLFMKSKFCLVFVLIDT